MKKHLSKLSIAGIWLHARRGDGSQGLEEVKTKCNAVHWGEGGRTNARSLLLTSCLAHQSQWMLVAHLMASCQPPCQIRAGPLGTSHSNTAGFPSPSMWVKGFCQQI